MKEYGIIISKVIFGFFSLVFGCLLDSAALEGVASIGLTGRATDRSLVSGVYPAQSMFVLRTCQDIGNIADSVGLYSVLFGLVNTINNK